MQTCLSYEMNHFKIICCKEWRYPLTAALFCFCTLWSESFFLRKHAEAHNLCTRRVRSNFLWSSFFAGPIHGGCLQSHQMSSPYLSAAAKSNLNQHDQTASKCTIILSLSINAFVQIMPWAIHKWVRTNRIEIFGYEYTNRKKHILYIHTRYI